MWWSDIRANSETDLAQTEESPFNLRYSTVLLVVSVQDSPLVYNSMAPALLSSPAVHDSGMIEAIMPSCPNSYKKSWRFAGTVTRKLYGDGKVAPTYHAIPVATQLLVGSTGKER